MKTSDVKIELLKDFRSGKYNCGDRIPPEKDLVEKFNISRSTLREVIGSLVQEGLLERKQGSGTYLKKLERNSNPLIGIMVSYITQAETIFARLVQELEHEFADRGYSIVLGSHCEDPVRATQQISRFIQLKVAGIVMVPVMLPHAEESNLELVRTIGAADIPFVLTDSQISVRTNSWFSCVNVNNFQGMRQLVKYLNSIGHRRIAHIKGLADVYSSEMRYDGYLETMRECGLNIPPEYIQEIKVGRVETQGRNEIKALMSLPKPPTAITCVHDLIAGNVIEELRRMGYRVPEDVAVTGFDNIPVPGLPQDFLTTVEQPIGEMARTAVNIMMQKITGNLSGEVQQGIQCRLKIRNSCSRVQEKVLTY